MASRSGWSQKRVTVAFDSNPGLRLDSRLYPGNGQYFKVEAAIQAAHEASLVDAAADQIPAGTSVDLHDQLSAAADINRSKLGLEVHLGSRSRLPASGRRDQGHFAGPEMLLNSRQPNRERRKDA
jgi:hypothetical protein